MQKIDSDILLYLNHTVASDPLLLKVVSALGDNSMARGFPLFASLIYLWFRRETVEARCRMLVGILATCLALAFSLLAQHTLTVHIRPLFDPDLDIVNILRWDFERFGKRHYSFPSDIAVLYFGLCAVVFAMDRSLGLVTYAWCAVTAGVCRVALGIHYPSDIVAGLVWGSCAVIIADRIPSLRHAAVNMVSALDPAGRLANMFFVLFLLEAYSVFPGLEATLVILVKAVA